MSKAFEEISAGLDDAIKHARGRKNKVVVHKWEQGLRSPRGPARVLLKVVDNDPSAVIRVVSG